MLIPISWLKDFVEIKLPLKDLMWKMTEAGLTCESYKKVGDDIVLDVEVTANRPDWMSIVGVAREVAAIQGLKLKKQKEITLPKKSANFPIDLIPDYKLFDRWTGIVIKNVDIKPSPKCLAGRIRLMGHSPINNVIDITNYMMYEYGIPMHAFDYDEIEGQVMNVQLSKGGEEFTSVDEISYKLPKDAIIIRDANRLIDLAGIKGGLNSGIKSTTKNIFLHVTIDNPALVRRTSIALGLRSEASAIYERGPDKGGTVDSIKRAANLVLKLAGGEIASEIVDFKNLKESFEPKKLILTFEKLESVLGIKIEPKVSFDILSKLNLNPRKVKDGIECLIPTYRADIKVEEDLVEEVARIYGYNKFPLTLPSGHVAKTRIPYYFDDLNHRKIKNLLTSAGFSEIMTLSLTSGETIEKFLLKTSDHVKITNPISLEYEYMRTTLLPSLVSALKINTHDKVKLFELDKIYPSEDYKISAAAKGIDFSEFKGLIDLLIERLNINSFSIEFETDKTYMHRSIAGTIMTGNDVLGVFGGLSPVVLNNFSIKDKVFVFELDTKVLEKRSKINVFQTVPENPPQIEDLTLEFPAKTRIGDVISKITSINRIIKQIELRDIYQNSYTFRITYQHPEKTLTDKEVEEIRNKVLQIVKEKFGGEPKV